MFETNSASVTVVNFVTVTLRYIVSLTMVTGSESVMTSVIVSAGALTAWVTMAVTMDAGKVRKCGKLIGETWDRFQPFQRLPTSWRVEA
jgi:hypothetical protein